MLSPDGFIHAEVVNIETFCIAKYGIILHLFQNTEAVAQQPVLLHGGKDRPGRVFQQGFQSCFIIFLGAGTKQVRADPVMDLSHLLQQIDHSGNIPDFRETDLHRLSFPGRNYHFLDL